MHRVSPLKARASIRFINQLDALIEEYEDHVQASNLAESSKRSYVSFVKMFLSFVEGNYDPLENYRG